VHTVCLRCACAYGVCVCIQCAYGVCVLTVCVHTVCLRCLWFTDRHRNAVHRQAQDRGSQTGTWHITVYEYAARYKNTAYIDTQHVHDSRLNVTV
jgi:hypothetical protein